MITESARHPDLAYHNRDTDAGGDLRQRFVWGGGGVNSMIPVVVVATFQVALVDADGMGRAFPEIQMVTPTLHDVSATPMALADEKGNRVLLETPDNFWTEQLARTVTIQMGCSACVALYAMQGAVAKKALVPGTISLARDIGQLLITSRAEKCDPLVVLTSLLHGRRLCEGKITDVRRRTERGFARGEIDIVGAGTDAGSHYQVSFQNENLVFWHEGQAKVTVPDLITIVDEQTGLPITTEALKYGLRVAVLGFPCHPQWRTPAGLQLVGPKYFGYEIDYVPLQSNE